MPPYRALRGLQAVVRDGWADRMARRYASHAQLVPPFREKAADLRPTTHGWVDDLRERDLRKAFAALSSPPKPGPVEAVLSELIDRVRRYFAAHSTVGVVGGAETGLARLCLMLARFEAGVLPEPDATVEQIHRSVPEDEVRELVGLVRKLPRALGDRLDGPGAMRGVAEPVFVHGLAEGDLMIGDTLVAVSLGDAAEVARRLRHLVAHAWLDTGDLYGVRAAGVYLADPGALVTWPVADLAARLLSGADPDAARAEFRALAEREIAAARPVARPDATPRHRRHCAVVETTMPAPGGRPRPGWSVRPNGPTCPSRDLAELAVPFCAGLPDGWRLDYSEGPYGNTAPHWEAVKGGQKYRSSRADADGLALVHFFATEHKTPSAPVKTKKPTVYGPEAWKTAFGAEWTYWDLWFGVVCVADHNGDWDELDASLYAKPANRNFAERMWSHLVDLKERLAATGKTAADLVGGLAADRKTLAKARSKVKQGTGVRSKDHSPAMRDTPSHRHLLRTHFGSWDLYPVSPRPFYQRLSGATPFDLEAPGWGISALENIRPLFDALNELEAEHADDPPVLLAVRRAGLTAASLAFHRCDDSYGALGDDASAAMLRFTRTDWRATGIDATVFWRDVLEVFAVLANFGATYKNESELMANLGADRDRALLDPLVKDLRASYAADRLDWFAKELGQFWDSV
ncbi:hypothetical protein [Actinomadura napierensis]|uniref:hypothetical protein n=1 Tax=Actinomadura napierensis TaxID=267854 RepID=UPI0031DB6A30